MIKFFKKYFSVLFLLSLFLGTTHHHSDLKIHNDCKICILQSNVVNVDVPTQMHYLSDIVIISEAIFFTPTLITNQKIKNQLHSRAPPFFL